jgi:hypothetical protein
MSHNEVLRALQQYTILSKDVPGLLENLVVSLNVNAQQVTNTNRLNLVLQALSNMNNVVSFETVLKTLNNVVYPKLTGGSHNKKTKKHKK